MLHSKIIAQLAKEKLAPLGIFQKGRSRTWIDDRGWWIVVIEFQPSSWTKGTYLNVGAMWLWNEKDYFSFDIGHRIAAFVEYLDEKQFTHEATKLASAAQPETLRLRGEFASISHAARYLPDQAKQTGSLWVELGAAIALGYIGDTVKARAFFASIESKKPTHEWEARLRETARGFAEALDAQADFQHMVEETIWRARKLLKLPEREGLGL